jgi:LysR family transcriptional regulator, transcription activator of glutamate synthase operon
MDIRQLEIFVACAHRASFTHAAQELGIAQPAVSQAIARLEDDLGVSLFDRRGRDVRLTEEGGQLLPYARSVLKEMEAARRMMEHVRTRKNARLRVGVTPTVATHLLPRVLAALRQDHPHIDVILRESGNATLLSMIERGLVDLGIIVVAAEHPTIVIEPLFTEPLLLAVAEHSALAAKAHGAPISLALAKDERFILYRASYHLRAATIEGCRRAQFAPQVALEGGEMETVLRMVEAGLGVSLVPRLAFQSARPGVAALAVSDPPLQRTLGIARRHEDGLTPTAEAFLAVMKREAARIVDRA